MSVRLLLEFVTPLKEIGRRILFGIRIKVFSILLYCFLDIFSSIFIPSLLLKVNSVLYIKKLIYGASIKCYGT